MSKKKNKKSLQSKYIADVVITTSGRWDYLAQCLDALKIQTVKPHIIVVDNASGEDEREANKHLFLDVSSTRLKNPLGYSAANNTGAKLGASQIILFLNDDCILSDPQSIEKMTDTMFNDQTIGVLGIKLLFPPTSTHPNRPGGKVQHIGIGLTIRGETFHPLMAWSANHPKTSVSRDTFAVTGACLMTKRVLFNKIGGFDLIYGQGTYEDVDYCMKARAFGQRVFVNADVVGYHYAGATAEKKQVAFPMQLNFNIFRTRWQGSPLMMWDEFSYY